MESLVFGLIFFPHLVVAGVVPIDREISTLSLAVGTRHTRCPELGPVLDRESQGTRQEKQDQADVGVSHDPFRVAQRPSAAAANPGPQAAARVVALRVDSTSDGFAKNGEQSYVADKLRRTRGQTARQSTLGDLVKLTKFAVLALGVLGVASFFLPLIHLKVDNFEGKASAFQVVQGVEQAKKLTKDLRTKATDNMAAKVDDVVANERLKGQLDELRKNENTATYVVLLPFIPPVLFLLFGILGLVKGSFGRGLGAGTLLFALLGVGMWVLLYLAAKDQNVEDSLGTGAYALALSYAGATVLGILTLLKPDTGDNW